MSKVIRIFLNFWRISIYEHIFCYWHFLITSIFKSLYLLKWCPIFDTSPLTQFSKCNNFLWVCWFLGKNLSDLYPPFENSTTRIAILTNYIVTFTNQPWLEYLFCKMDVSVAVSALDNHCNCGNLKFNSVSTWGSSVATKTLLFPIYQEPLN